MRSLHLALLLVALCACDADCDPVTLSCSGSVRPPPPDAGDGFVESACDELPCLPVIIAAGAQHTCASVADIANITSIAFEGETLCWGRNDHHQVGLGDEPFVVVPERSRFGFSWSIGAGAIHTCVTDHDRIGCWGRNAAGLLGWPGVDDHYASRFPFAQAGHPLVVALGAAHACTLDDDETVRCFGDNTFGQLGDVEDPYLVQHGSWLALPGPVRALSAGGLMTCAWVPSEGLFCWGREGAAQAPREVPWKVRGVHEPSTFAVGASHACVIEEGAVRCFGDNAHGQLGLGTRGGRTSEPGEPVPLPGPARSVAVGGWIGVHPVSHVEIAYDEPSPAHTCALLQGGEIWCWGANGRGQLGDGTTDDRLTPVRVELDDIATDITAGGEHTCAIARARTIHCWGANEHAQLGAEPSALPFSAAPIMLELP